LPVAKQSPSWNDEQKERAWKWIQIRFLQVFTVYILNTKGRKAVTEGRLREGEIQLLKNASLQCAFMSIISFLHNAPKTSSM
jgi:hypothetical protein